MLGGTPDYDDPNIAPGWKPALDPSRAGLLSVGSRAWPGEPGDEQDTCEDSGGPGKVSLS